MELVPTVSFTETLKTCSLFHIKHIFKSETNSWTYGTETTRYEPGTIKVQEILELTKH